jgi:hypothetical protein
MKHQFEAKHVIVASCAAVAMVLGAMSVGASLPSSNEHQATKAEVSSIVSSAPAPKKSSSTVGSSDLSSQHTLEVRNFLQQQDTPLYTAPAPSKASRNLLSPIFGTSDPVRLIDQMVQLQQQIQQPGTTTPDKAATSDPATTTPTDSTATDSSKSTDNTTGDPSTKPTPDPTAPTDGGTTTQNMATPPPDPTQLP